MASNNNSNKGQTLPTILIIHGAWHHPAYYQLLVNALESRGYETFCPALPSCNNDTPPTKCLKDDVALIRNTVSELVHAGKEIVVLMHSYGGIVGTDALHGFGIKDSKTKEDGASDASAGGVTKLLYMCAFLPQKGQSLAGIFNGALPPFIDVHDEKNLLVVPNPAPCFYNDLPADEATYWSNQLVVHPKSAQFTPVSNEAYKSIPATYLLCENDAALPPEVQQMMVDTLKGVGVSVDVVRFSGSHSPFLSMPQATADVISEIVLA